MGDQKTPALVLRTSLSLPVKNICDYLWDPGKNFNIIDGMKIPSERWAGKNRWSGLDFNYFNVKKSKSKHSNGCYRAHGDKKNTT
jgi:hypothetical protein